MKLVTVTITPNVTNFIRAFKQLGRAVEVAHRQMKRLQRKTAILNKQMRRNEIRNNRRPALIHNGRKPR